jgi:hypothetical protein
VCLSVCVSVRVWVCVRRLYVMCVFVCQCVCLCRCVYQTLVCDVSLSVCVSMCLCARLHGRPVLYRRGLRFATPKASDQPRACSVLSCTTALQRATLPHSAFASSASCTRVCVCVCVFVCARMCASVYVCACLSLCVRVRQAFGVGIHHAGLNPSDRDIVEDLFVNEQIQARSCHLRSIISRCISNE